MEEIHLLLSMDREFSVPRSGHWPTVRKKHLVDHPNCALCGSNKKIEVHHIKPFHLHPDLELDPTNLITLCESGSNGVICHLLFGHLGNFKSINPNVVEDVALWATRIEARLV